MEDEGTKPPRRQRPLPSHDSSPEPGQDARGSHGNGCRHDELSSTHAESDEEERWPRPTKRKRPSLSNAGLAQKKRKHHLQQRSTRERRARSSPIDTLWSHNPSLIGFHESTRALKPRVNCLRRLLLRHEPWIRRCHLTTLTLADHPVISYLMKSQ
jgi:hypothetical protein